MSDIATTSSLAEIIEALPGSRRTFERLGLDYCCGGQRSLGDACADLALDPSAVVDELRLADEEPVPDWASMAPATLVDHLEAVHHAYLHTEMERLTALAEKVASVHGSRHPELADVERTYAELRADLEPHLLKEERILFPAIRQLADGEAPAALPGGSVHAPISVMLRDHDRAGDLLAELRRLTDGYRPPADGCASYQALYEGLAELEADTHLHVHKENNVLFPAVLALEGARAGGPSPVPQG